MKYKFLGRSGLRVSELCLGAMTFGEEWGWGSPKDTSRAIFDAYADAGGNFIDTANFYTEGTSEKLVGEFIEKRREQFVIATKYSLSMNPKDPNASGNHRKNMRQSVEASLKRLKTDYIDLYWLHIWDDVTPVDEVMRSLDDLVRAGKILYVGISDAPAYIISQANTMADLRGWTPFVAMQLEYSLIERRIEREHFSLARDFGLAICPWSPLGMGALTGKYATKEEQNARFSKDPSWAKVYLTERNLKIIEKVQQVSKEVNRSPAQVAINWVLQQGNDVIPIIGASKLPQLKDNLASTEFKLTQKQLDQLNEVSNIDLGFPNEFMHRSQILDILFGEAKDKIDSPRMYKGKTF